MKLTVPVVLLALAVTPPESRALVRASPLADPAPVPGLWDWAKDKASKAWDWASGAASTASDVASEVVDEAAAQLLDKYDQYSNINQADNRHWMGRYKDETLISQLSIPGTHDSLTWRSIMTPIAQCQSFDLATQFKGGIRFLDVRARHWNNQFEIFHGVMPTTFGMTYVLQEIQKFLAANPTETIIFRHKDENSAYKCDRTYAQTYEWYRTQKSETKGIYAKYAWTPKNPDDPEIPTLGELRGKFLVLMDFDDAPKNGGLRWSGGGKTEIQDHYDVNNNNIGEKWKSIASSLELARSDKTKTDKIYLSFLSAASAEVWPRPLALGSNDYTGMNVLTMAQLKAYRATGDMTPVGIVIMDFPGKELAELLINLTPQKLAKRRASTTVRNWLRGVRFLAKRII